MSGRVWTVTVPPVVFQCRLQKLEFLQWHSSVGLFQLSFSFGVPVYPASIHLTAQWYPSVHWVNQWHSSGIPLYTGPASVHWLRVRDDILLSIWCIYSSDSSLIARFMGPTWGPSGADRTQVGPMLAPWTWLSVFVLKVAQLNAAHSNVYCVIDCLSCWEWNKATYHPRIYHDFRIKTYAERGAKVHVNRYIFARHALNNV